MLNYGKVKKILKNNHLPMKKMSGKEFYKRPEKYFHHIRLKLPVPV